MRTQPNSLGRLCLPAIGAGLLTALCALFLGAPAVGPALAAPLAYPLEGAGTMEADADASGVITQSTTWDLASSPYTLTGTVTVNPGVTLTIEAGVQVMGQSGTELSVRGGLVALGTAAQPITFTSVEDNNPGQWAG
ncbi:MAG: hypothetical protein JW850_02920, partial [Thermoflexales bacterium]|nr:hypothetical protein [Thermoflexales bacterium]